MVFYTFTCGSIFLLSFLLMVHPGRTNSAGNRWLAVFLFCAGAALLAFIAEHTALQKQHRWLVPVLELNRLVMAPALLLSVTSFLFPQRKLSWRDSLHMIPALLFAGMMLPYLLSLAGIRWPLPPLVPPGTALSRYLGLLVGMSVKLQLLVYWGLSYRLLAHYRGTTGVRWLKYLLWGTAGMILIWFNQLFDGVRYLLPYTAQGYLLSIYVIGYSAFRQQEVAGNSIVAPALPPAVVKPRLPAEQIPPLMKQLDRLMEEEALYTDGELGLPKLADHLGLSTHELSFLLNQGYGKSFFQYINGYRVACVKKLLLAPGHAHLNILAIAFEAGFNSKTTFNSVFRDATGMSPSAFRQAAGVLPASQTGAEAPGLVVRMDPSGR
ncbi:helix-turn-helix transcriptional regulator [Chitinophaga oryzae]|uniref:Helix-turn-helix transcriptional regulator n=1 Tax=Chitinophaga oryzae TaxID=2725414 RepID=A0ABX6LE06_9BACT|nr:helix-turn-helix transcriptional regulator [Chitinophaga oryzae]QJB38062.1 helix-turn-helix transcriptional regulator [Chitinophaga oryzae]